jgi:hypothetical protein
MGAYLKGRKTEGGYWNNLRVNGYFKGVLV